MHEVRVLVYGSNLQEVDNALRDLSAVQERSVEQLLGLVHAALLQAEDTLSVRTP